MYMIKPMLTQYVFLLYQNMNAVYNVFRETLFYEIARASKQKKLSIKSTHQRMFMMGEGCLGY